MDLNKYPWLSKIDSVVKESVDKLPKEKARRGVVNIEFCPSELIKDPLSNGKQINDFILEYKKELEDFMLLYNDVAATLVKGKIIFKDPKRQVEEGFRAAVEIYRKHNEGGV